MKKLYDVVELVEVNENCVMLKVKDNAELDLMCMGCFLGSEKFIRVFTKYNYGNAFNSNVFTIWFADGTIEFYNEKSSSGCVEQELKKMILDCIKNDFKIDIYA